eukprot:scaffold705_cov402-Prasinococcus_capsulatus_cf.AAC.51
MPQPRWRVLEAYAGARAQIYVWYTVFRPQGLHEVASYLEALSNARGRQPVASVRRPCMQRPNAITTLPYPQCLARGGFRRPGPSDAGQLRNVNTECKTDKATLTLSSVDGDAALAIALPGEEHPASLYCQELSMGLRTTRPGPRPHALAGGRYAFPAGGPWAVRAGRHRIGYD